MTLQEDKALCYSLSIKNNQSLFRRGRQWEVSDAGDGLGPGCIKREPNVEADSFLLRDPLFKSPHPRKRLPLLIEKHSLNTFAISFAFCSSDSIKVPSKSKPIAFIFIREGEVEYVKESYGKK